LQSSARDRLKCVAINADQNFRLSNTYRLTTLPTLLIFDQGAIRQRVEGFKGRESLEHLLQTCLGGEAVISLGSD
jgi:thioredoxin 1